MLHHSPPSTPRRSGRVTQSKRQLDFPAESSSPSPSPSDAKRVSLGRGTEDDLELPSSPVPTESLSQPSSQKHLSPRRGNLDDIGVQSSPALTESLPPLTPSRPSFSGRDKELLRLIGFLESAVNIIHVWGKGPEPNEILSTAIKYLKLEDIWMYGVDSLKITDFVKKLTTLLGLEDGPSNIPALIQRIKTSGKEKITLVIEGAENIPITIRSELLSELALLPDLLLPDCHFTLCLTSELGWADLFPVSSVPPPHQIYLRALSEEALIERIASNAPVLVDPKKYGQFAKVFVKSNIIQYPPWIIQARAPSQWEYLQSTWDDSKPDHENFANKLTFAPANSLPTSSSFAGLPTAANYLIIAAFLASNNPASTDGYYFGAAQKSTVKRSVKKKPPLKLQMPRLFPYERLRRIYSAITTPEYQWSSGIQSLIPLLVDLHLLARMSADGQLTRVRFRCNVGIRDVTAIAQAVGVPLEMYLPEEA